MTVLETMKLVAGLVYFLQKQKTFQNSPSHQIFKRMYRTLNTDKNKKLITQFVCNLRHESFESS